MTAWHWIRRRPLLYLWLPVVAWMGLIFYLSAQPELPQLHAGWVDLVISSMAHAFVFGVLAVLWARALGERRHALILTSVFTMLYALTDEFHQAFVPGRYPDLWDVVCDGLGAVLGLGLWVWWRRH